MTLEEMMNQADAEAFDAEMAYLDSLPLIKGGECPQCEWSQNDCHCVEYGLPLPQQATLADPTRPTAWAQAPTRPTALYDG